MSKWRNRGIEVLLVEDSADDYEIIRNVLEENRIAYKHVRDGELAVQYVLSVKSDAGLVTPLHLILLDLNLPKLSGFEVLRRIRGERHAQNIPVVILSSTDDEREIDQAYEKGANSFVIKPIEFEKFVRLLTSILNYWTQVNESHS